MPLPLADNVKSENTIKSNDLWCESVLTLQHTDRSKLSVRSENYFQKGECRLKTIGGKMTKMKLTKKKVLVGALAVGLIATISAGSLAWFSDEDEVKNKFMIADSTDDDPEDIFSVDVKEDTPEGSGDTDGYDYEDILPGDELKKELADEIKNGLEIRPTKEVQTGFRLAAKDGSGYFDCSDEGIMEMLMPYFRDLDFQ